MKSLPSSSSVNKIAGGVASVTFHQVGASARFFTASGAERENPPGGWSLGAQNTSKRGGWPRLIPLGLSLTPSSMFPDLIPPRKSHPTPHMEVDMVLSAYLVLARGRCQAPSPMVKEHLASNRWHPKTPDAAHRSTVAGCELVRNWFPADLREQPEAPRNGF